jgi:hypothetical protein
MKSEKGCLQQWFGDTGPVGKSNKKEGGAKTISHTEERDMRTYPL